MSAPSTTRAAAARIGVLIVLVVLPSLRSTGNIPAALQMRDNLFRRTKLVNTVAKPLLSLGVAPRTLQNIKRLQRSANGGAILFWHVPKTGGSTLRSLYKRRNYHNLIQWVDMGLSNASYQKRKYHLENAFLANSSVGSANGYHGRFLFWEIHGGPSLSSLDRDVNHWRSLAIHHNKTFFAFTLLRNGPDAATSYFNFYCTPLCPNNEQFVNNLTNSEEDFIGGAKDTWANYQSRILFHGHYDSASWMNHTVKGIDMESAIEMYEATTFDWIGVTEQLSNVTIPLIDYMVKGPVPETKQVKLEKVAEERYSTLEGRSIARIRTKTLSPDHQRLLREHTKIDTFLWKRALEEYKWDRSDPTHIRVLH